MHIFFLLSLYFFPDCTLPIRFLSFFFPSELNFIKYFVMLKLAGPTQQLPLHICPTSKMYPNSSAAYNAPQNLALSSSSALSTERHLGDQRQHQLPQPQQAQQPQQPQQAQQQYPVLSYPPGATVRSQFATPPQVAPAALQPPAQYFQYSPAYAVGPNQQSPQFPHVSMPAQPYVYERSIPQYYSQLPVAPASPYGYQAQAAAAQLPAEVTLRAPPPRTSASAAFSATAATGILDDTDACAVAVRDGAIAATASGLNACVSSNADGVSANDARSAGPGANTSAGPGASAGKVARAEETLL